MALIDSILAARAAGTTIEPTKQVLARFAESRSVKEFQARKQPTFYLRDRPQYLAPGETVQDRLASLGITLRARPDFSQTPILIRSSSGQPIQPAIQTPSAQQLESGETRVTPQQNLVRNIQGETAVFEKGSEEGVIVDRSGQPIASTTRDTFKPIQSVPSQIEKRGTVQSLILGSEGEELMDQTQASNLSLDMGDVSDYTDAAGAEVSQTQQQEILLLQGTPTSSFGADVGNIGNFSKAVWGDLRTQVKGADYYSTFDFKNIVGDFRANFPAITKGAGKISSGIVEWYPTTKIPGLIADIKELHSKIDVGRLKLQGLEISEENLAIRKQQDIVAGKYVKFFLLGAATTPGGIGRQIFRETIPLRQRAPATVTEIIRTDIIKGKPFRYSDYKIYTEKAPPRITYTTSLTKQQYGKLPTDITYLPPIVSKTTTPFKAIPTEPFVTLTTKGGAVGETSIISGTSQRLDILQYSRLPKTQQYLVRQLAETRTGVPVAEQNIFKILSTRSEKIRFISDIDIEKALRINLKPRMKIVGEEFVKQKYSLYAPGKRITRYQAITEVTPLKETDLFELSTSKVLFKDVTMPFARAKGKTPSLDVVTIEYKQPNIISLGDKGVRFMQPADIIKTPLDRTFMKQIQIQKQPTIYAPVKIPKAQGYTKTISTPLETRQTSLYAGTGLYERTEGGQLPATSTFTLETPRTFTTTYPATKTFERETTKFVMKPITKEVTKTIEKVIPKEIAKEILKPMQRTIQKPMQRLIQKQISRPMSRVPRSLFFKQSRLTRQKPLMLYKPTAREKGINLFGGIKLFVKEKGIWTPKGIFKDVFKATAVGKYLTGETIHRSFKIEGGRAGLPFGYRYSRKKGQQDVFVELSKTAISQRGERKALSLGKLSKGIFGKSKPRKMKGGKRK